MGVYVFISSFTRNISYVVLLYLQLKQKYAVLWSYFLMLRFSGYYSCCLFGTIIVGILAFVASGVKQESLRFHSHKKAVLCYEIEGC
jgi:hypothetical protein